MKRIFVLFCALYMTCAFTVVRAAGNELNLYNWTDYVSTEMLQKFEKETGIKVKVDNYDTNETLLAKLKSGNAGYDVVIVSHDFVGIFIKEKLLQEYNPNKLSTFKNLKETMRSPSWDPGNKYSVPWASGSTAFSYNKSKIKGKVDSLKTLFEPPANAKGRVGMMNSATEVINLAFIYLNKDYCTTNANDYKQLLALLEKQKPFVRSYSSDGIEDKIANEEVWIQHMWDGNAAKSKAKNKNIEYAFPKEGVIKWVDNMAVPQGAPNVENAKKFVEFYMKPENAAMNSNYHRYDTPYIGAANFYSKELKDSLLIVPDNIKGHFIVPCADSAKVTALQDRVWRKLKN